MSARKREARPAGAATRSGANSTEDELAEAGSKNKNSCKRTARPAGAATQSGANSTEDGPAEAGP